MKKLTVATIIVAIISILFIASPYVFMHTELSYRMWVQVCGAVTVIFILPLLLIVSAGRWLYRIVRVNNVIKVILSLAVGAGYILWAYFGILLMAFSINTEKRLTDDLLVVNEGFLDPFYVYYRPVAFFFKVPGELTDDTKVEYLEEKYHKEFHFISGQENTETKIYAEGYPEISISVSLSGMELTDNYVECIATRYLEEGCRELGITREYYVSENYVGHTGWMYMELKDETDIPVFAQDASRLIQYVMGKTDLWEEHRGSLCFYSREGELEITGHLSFGKMNQWDEMSSDYYLDPGQIEIVLAAQYKDEKDFLERMQEQQKVEPVIRGDAAESDKDATLNEVIQETVSPIEQAAQTVYNTVLKAEGYTCEVKYNANGNLYLDLGSRPAGEPEDKSSTGTYRFSLVYDRTSKNGACELFVLYKAHYTEDGMNDGSAILDMYAVETAMGNVIAADKHSWEELGCKAYRDATGE